MDKLEVLIRQIAEAKAEAVSYSLSDADDLLLLARRNSELEADLLESRRKVKKLENSLKFNEQKLTDLAKRQPLLLKALKRKDDIIHRLEDILRDNHLLHLTELRETLESLN